MNEDISFFEKIKVSSGEKPGWVIFLFSLLTAFILWFFLSLDESYKETVEIKLNYINNPKNKVLSYPLPESLMLQIKAKGQEIIRIKHWAEKNSITVDLRQYKDKIEFSDFRIRNLLPEKLDKISIISIQPSLVQLSYDNIFSMKVPVLSRVKYSCKSDYCTLDLPKIKPSDVEIFGPEKEIRKVTHIYTVDTHFSNLNKSVNANVKLKQPENPNIRLSTTHVNVSIPVEQLTEGHLNLFINIPPDLKNKIILLPPKIDLTFQTVLSKYATIGANDFYPNFSPDDIKSAKSAKVKINVSFDSTKIKNIRYSPEYVGFILK